MLAATLLAIFLVPVLYVAVNRRSGLFSRRAKAAPAGEGSA